MPEVKTHIMVRMDNYIRFESAIDLAALEPIVDRSTYEVLKVDDARA